VLVLAGCGPAGMAMPEWCNIPIPAKLLSQGVTDMLRITDGRMSGTGFGTVVLHMAPGWPVLHRMHLLQAPDGCDYDFLAARTPDQLTFIEPVIGRS
jgi:L-arabonate dehydrase